MALAAGLAAVAALQACQSTPEAMDANGGAARPPDPLQDFKEARFENAIAGLDFTTGVAFVVEPTGEDRGRAGVYYADGLERLAGNHLTGSIRLFAMAVRTDPDWTIAWNGLGRALQAKGKGEHAVAAFRTALAQDKEFAEGQYNLAFGLARLGRRADAIVEMNRLLELDPGNAAAHERLAIWYYYNGDDDAAWQHVHAARDLGREPPAQLVTLLEGRPPRARRVETAD